VARSSIFARRNWSMAAPFRGRHEPCARALGHAGVRPVVEGRQQRVLRQVLGRPHVPREAREAGDQLRELDPADGLDRACELGRRHDR
jgi:hypothetical protein